MKSARKASSSRGSKENEASASLSLDYDQLLRLALKQWRWLTLFVVVGVVIGLVHALSQVPLYAAKATIVIQEKEAKISNLDDVGQPDAKSGDLIKTFEQLLATRSLMERVVKTEHLDQNPDFLPKGVEAPVSEEAASDLLLESVLIHIRPLTRLIDITVEHRSPQLAQLLANRIAEESIAQEFDQLSESAHSQSQHLEKERAELQQKLADAQQAVQDYRNRNPQGLSLDTTEDVVVTRLKDLNSRFMDAQAQVRLLQDRYGPSHPKMMQAVATQEELRHEVAKAQAEALSLGGTSIGYAALQSVADSYRLQYENVLKALTEAEVAENVSIPGISVAEQAQLPYAPVSPNKKKEVILGALGGLLCGLGLVFGLYFMDSSLRTVAQAESTLGLRVVAAVPILTEAELRESGLPTLAAPQSFVAEAFRGLRASLLLHDRESPVKTILVASAAPSEGKSFCAANVAVALAQVGLRTLLIDADLRLPTAHTYFRLPPSEAHSGFTDVLSGKGTLASSVIVSSIPNLSLLLTTTAADFPAELLSSPRLPLLMEEAAQSYDRIVIDTAPLNAVSDTMLLMPKADAILLVIRAGQTPASECQSALEKISSSKMKPLGLILNYLPLHSLKTYAYGYSYGKKPPEK